MEYVGRRMRSASHGCLGGGRRRALPITEHAAAHEFGGVDATPYEQIEAPTLIVAGARDRLRLPGFASELANRIPKARALVIEKSGHCPNIEDGAVVAEAVTAFLKGGDESDGASETAGRSVSGGSYQLRKRT